MAILFDWMHGAQNINKDGKVLSATELGIIWQAASHADPNTGGNICPGIKVLALGAGSTEHKVVQTLRKARAMNILERVRKGSRGGREADEYRLVHPNDWHVKGSKLKGGKRRQGY